MASIPRQAEVRPPAVQSNGNPMGQYTTLLKEYADSIGAGWSTTFKEITMDPPLFAAIIEFSGRTFEGRAKSKKEARHQAALKACEGLHITGQAY